MRPLNSSTSPYALIRQDVRPKADFVRRKFRYVGDLPDGEMAMRGKRLIVTHPSMPPFFADFETGKMGYIDVEDLKKAISD